MIRLPGRVTLRTQWSHEGANWQPDGRQPLRPFQTATAMNQQARLYRRQAHPAGSEEHQLVHAGRCSARRFQGDDVGRLPRATWSLPVKKAEAANNLVDRVDVLTMRRFAKVIGDRRRRSLGVGLMQATSSSLQDRLQAEDIELEKMNYLVEVSWGRFRRDRTLGCSDRGVSGVHRTNPRYLAAVSRRVSPEKRGRRAPQRGSAASHPILRDWRLPFALFGLFVACAGAGVTGVYYQMYRGAFGSWFSVQNTRCSSLRTCPGEYFVSTC